MCLYNVTKHRDRKFCIVMHRSYPYSFNLSMFPQWNAIDERRRWRGCWSRVSQSDCWYQKHCISPIISLLIARRHRALRCPNTFSAINDTSSPCDVQFTKFYRPLCNKFPIKNIAVENIHILFIALVFWH